MTEQAIETTVPEIISDEQVDDFFSKGGVAETDDTIEEKPEAETPEPEAKADEPKAEEPKPDKVVPYGALHEERMRRKELQEQQQQSAERIRKMEETFQKLLEKTQASEAPRFEDDPVAALKHQNDQLQQRLSHYDQRFQQNDQQAAAYQQQQKFVSDYQQAAAEFAKTTPNFQDAYTYLVTTRQNELEAIGYTKQQAANILVQEEAMIVGKAFEDEANPAERMYKLAQFRGWKPAEAPTPEVSEKSPDEARMDALEKGATASKTLSGGGKAPEPLSLEALAAMDDDDFDKAWDKIVGKS